MNEPRRTALSGGRARRGSAAALAGGILCCSIALPVPSARADATYDAFGRTDSGELTASNQSIPAGLVVEGGGTEAEARQTSLGSGDASAQFPYAGNTVPGLLGLASSLLGVPAPPYPLEAASTRGSKPQTVSYPGATLHAESGDFATIGSAVAGSDSSGSASSSKVEEARDGTVTSTSQTSVDGLRLGALATLSGVRTDVLVSADGTTGTLTRRTSTSIDRISAPAATMTVPKQTPGETTDNPVPGQPPIVVPPMAVPGGGTTITDPDIGVKDGSFTLTVPVGGGSQRVPVPAKTVQDSLKGAGIRMTFQAPQKTRTGIIAGTYTFTYDIPPPPPNPKYSGPTHVVQTTGLALASVDLHPVPSTGGVLGGFTGGTTGGSAPTGGTAALPGLAGTSGTQGTSTGTVGPGLASPALAGGAPSLSGAVRATDPSPEVTAPGGTTPAALTGLDVGTGIGNLYLALVAIALCGLTAATAMRLIGVRFLWSS